MTIVPDYLGKYLDYTVPDNVAGNPIRHTVTYSGRWLINSIYFNYICDANAGTRLPYIKITPGTAPLFYAGLHNKGFGANDDMKISCFHGTTIFSDPTVHNRAFIQLPRIAQISGTFEITFAADGMKAGDIIRFIHLYTSFWQEH